MINKYVSFYERTQWYRLNFFQNGFFLKITGHVAQKRDCVQKKKKRDMIILGVFSYFNTFTKCLKRNRDK